MDNQIKTSFIPRKPLVTGKGPGISTGSSMPRRINLGRTLFSFIATIIFIASLAAFGGTFLWKDQLNRVVAGQQEDMKKSLASFDERFIKEATRLDARIKEAEKILNNHVSPSILYALLSETTLETVAFSDFALQDTKDGGLKLTAKGEALKYNSIVLQSDSFGKSGFMRNVLFTNLAENNSNRIGFTFEAQLDPRLILYRDRNTVLNSSNQ